MRTLLLNTNKKKSIVVGMEGDHQSTRVEFGNIEADVTKDLYINIVGSMYENFIPLEIEHGTPYLVICKPMTLYPDDYECQIYKKKEVNGVEEYVEITDIFTLIVKKSLRKAEEGEYPVDVKSYHSSEFALDWNGGNPDLTPSQVRSRIVDSKTNKIVKNFIIKNVWGNPISGPMVFYLDRFDTSGCMHLYGQLDGTLFEILGNVYSDEWVLSENKYSSSKIEGMIKEQLSDLFTTETLTFNFSGVGQQSRRMDLPTPNVDGYKPIGIIGVHKLINNDTITLNGALLLGFYVTLNVSSIGAASSDAKYMVVILYIKDFS